MKEQFQTYLEAQRELFIEEYQAFQRFMSKLFK